MSGNCGEPNGKRALAAADEEKSVQHKKVKSNGVAADLRSRKYLSPSHFPLSFSPLTPILISLSLSLSLARSLPLSLSF